MEILESGLYDLIQPPDIDGLRKWNRENKSMALESKLMSEKEAMERFVSDGDYVGFELYGTCRAPLSLVRELVRQGRKNLRLAGQGLQDVDFLLAAGMVEAMDITYVGYEVHGLSPVLRRAAEKQGVKMVEWSNAALAWRFKAAAMGVSYLPIRSMLGTDTFKYSAGKVAECPFTGDRVMLLPALILDCGVIHVHKADQYGNCMLEGISGFALEMARASKKLVISAEEIVDNEEILKYPDRNVIPYYHVDAVVHAPFGSHPGEMPYLYGRDEPGIMEWLQVTKTEEGASDYLDKYIRNVPDHAAYIELVGGEEKLKELRALSVGR
ncbi:MAG: CoA transferase subunit A [bacterium]|nr:CoA transferase subunit A [bacterium]